MEKFTGVGRQLFTQTQIDLIIVALVGAGVLALGYITGFPRLCISDEIVYAVMGRNIADFRGPYTNFYWPNSIGEKGYPLGDVHVPGYMFILSIFFFLLGPYEFVAFLPSQLAFVLAGVVVFEVGKIAFNRQVGFWAALCSFLLPTNFIWANTAMTEATLTLLSAIFLWVWYRATTTPQLSHSFWLAILMVLGAFCREVFLIFLIPTLYTLWVWPRVTRFKAWLIFGTLFLTGMLVVFLPFYMMRAPYPHVLSDWLKIDDSTKLLLLLQDNIEKNLRKIFELSLRADHLSRFLEYLIFILALISLWKLEKKFRKISLYFLVTYLPTLLLMTVIYLIYQWFIGLRIFAMLLPAGIIAACALLYSLPVKGRYVALTVMTVGFLTVSLKMNTVQRASRQEEFTEQSILTQTILAQTSNLSPRVIMADHAFLYGWQRYPVTVIWRPARHLEEWHNLRKRIVVDVIVAEGEIERDKVFEGLARYPGLMVDKFSLLNQNAANGYYVFVRE